MWIRVVIGLLLIGMLGGCNMLDRMKVTRKTRAWEKRMMDPNRKMKPEERNQARENERRLRRQDKRIEEGSGGIYQNIEVKSGEVKEVKKAKKKKK